MIMMMMRTVMMMNNNYGKGNNKLSHNSLEDEVKRNFAELA